MFVQPIDYFLAVWFALAALSTAYVAWDQLRNNPEPVVMKWGFRRARCTYCCRSPCAMRTVRILDVISTGPA